MIRPLQKFSDGNSQVFTTLWGNPMGIFMDSHGFPHGFYRIPTGYFYIRHGSHWKEPHGVVELVV